MSCSVFVQENVRHFVFREDLTGALLLVSQYTLMKNGHLRSLFVGFNRLKVFS